MSARVPPPGNDANSCTCTLTNRLRETPTGRVWTGVNFQTLLFGVGFSKTGSSKIGFLNKNTMFVLINYYYSPFNISIWNLILVEMYARAPPPGNDANSCTCTLKSRLRETPADRGMD